MTDPKDTAYSMDWATRGARSELTWLDDLKQVAEYDLEGRLTQLQPRGPDATIDYTYNAAGESTGWTWTNGLESGSATLTRDSAGRIASASTTTMALTVSQEFTYDTESRLSELEQTIGNVTRTATATYRRDSQISTLTYPAGFTITYEYNADGQVAAIKKGTTTLASYGYDSAGRLSTRTLANGLTTHYSYNSMSRLTQLTVTGPGGTLWAQRYGFNAAGERAYTLDGTTGTIGDAYNLDATGQLTGVKYEATGADAGYASATNPSSTTTWSFDESGNRKVESGNQGTTTYTANAINQYTTITGAQSQGPLDYSPRGDLIENGDWTYTFDADGNLIRAHNSQSNTLAKYWRDAAGHRAVKDIDGQKTLFFNFGFWPLEAYDLTGETAQSTIYEPGIDQPLCEINDDGSIRFFYHQDWLGNVALLTDNAGAKLQTYTYEVWGEPSGFDATGNPIAASAFESRFLFTGREYDPETGLYHYRARAYSPSLGRFMQFDPIDFAGGDVNLVRYVGNQPTGLVDPLGLIWSLSDCYQSPFPPHDPIDWDSITKFPNDPGSPPQPPGPGGKRSPRRPRPGPGSSGGGVIASYDRWGNYWPNPYTKPSTLLSAGAVASGAILIWVPITTPVGVAILMGSGFMSGAALGASINGM